MKYWFQRLKCLFGIHVWYGDPERMIYPNGNPPPIYFGWTCCYCHKKREYMR